MPGQRPSRRFLRTARGQAKRQQAFAAIARSRRENISVAHAARLEGTTGRTVVRYLPGAVEKRAGGYWAKPYDRLRRRPMRVQTRGGERWIVPASSHQASLLGRHSSAIGRFIGSDDPDVLADAITELEAMEGQTVTGFDPDAGQRVSYELETDLRTVDGLARQGRLSPDSIYKE